MGYTHYFAGLQPTQELADQANKIVEAFDGAIASGFGHGEPTITADLISLNGSAILDEDYETFQIEAGKGGFNFTKTARRPYDAVVTAILVAAIVIEGSDATSIHSDGDFEEWSEGIDLYENAVRPLTEEEISILKSILG